MIFGLSLTLSRGEGTLRADVWTRPQARCSHVSTRSGSLPSGEGGGRGQIINSPIISYWFFRIRSTLAWYFSASTRYDLHSPLLADFVEQVIRDQRSYHVYALTDQLRNFWKQHPGEVTIQELGAPSKVSSAGRRKVSELVGNSAIPPDCGRILFRLALWLEAETIVELGTNAGISTLYLHHADRRAQLHTIEGNPEVAGLARKTFEVARCRETLHQYVGTFEELLQPVLEQLAQVDLLFIDGDHRYPQTVKYVKTALPKLHAGSVVVVADIHWSEGMERAWTELKALSEVSASLDLYHFGVLFFKPGVTPGQHLNLVKTRWKPWRVGFF